MDSLVIGAQAQTRFSLLLIGVFSTIAALLAGMGLYGVLATSVRQRTAEIGVRMALGAAPSRIFRLMVGKGLYLSVLGIAIGSARSACTYTRPNEHTRRRQTHRSRYLRLRSGAFPVHCRHGLVAPSSARRRIRSNHGA
jgi:hypothetical protein